MDTYSSIDIRSISFLYIPNLQPIQHSSPQLGSSVFIWTRQTGLDRQTHVSPSAPSPPLLDTDWIKSISSTSIARLLRIGRRSEAGDAKTDVVVDQSRRDGQGRWEGPAVVGVVGSCAVVELEDGSRPRMWGGW